MRHHILALCIIFVLTSLNAVSQAPEVIVSVGLSGSFRSQINESIFDNFEARHNVQIVMRAISNENFISLPDGSG